MQGDLLTLTLWATGPRVMSGHVSLTPFSRPFNQCHKTTFKANKFKCYSCPTLEGTYIERVLILYMCGLKYYITSNLRGHDYIEPAVVLYMFGLKGDTTFNTDNLLYCNKTLELNLHGNKLYG